MVTDNTALERLAHKERYAKVASGSGIVFGLIVAGAVVLFALYGNWIAALVGVSFAAIGIVLWRQRAIMGSLGVRLLWMSLVFGVALFYITMLPPDIDGHILLIPIMGLGLLLFSLKYERLIAYSVAAFVLVFFIVVDHISLQSQSPVLLGLPLISLGSHQVEKIVFEILPIIAFLAEVAVVSLLMNQTEERLIAEKSRAEASEKAKSMFMANMSHEIRTPMNGLLGMAQILETQNPTVDQRRSITVIKNSALALLRIIDDILDSSRIDAGKLSITPRRTEFLPIVEGVALTLMSMADDSDVRIRLFVDPLLPEWIRADAVRLRQIMFNLLSNGIKYSDSSMTKRHAFAYLIVEPVDDFTLRLVFWDNGVGMSDDVQKHLFEPYSRGNENEIQSQAGVGLGLMITRQLVSLMGGTIAVNSKQGEGTTITVTLPMIAESGPIKRPDLSGLTVVWMDYATDDVQEYTRRNYEAYNAKVIFEREVADLEAQGFDFDGDNIFVVRKEDAEASGRIRRQLAERVKAPKILVLTRNRAEDIGMLDENTYRVQYSPLLPTEYYRMVAALTGRQSAGKPVEVRDRSPEAIPLAHTDSDDGPRIIVVEDNAINRMVLDRQLQTLGYPAKFFTNGCKALDHWQDEPVDLILTDCRMPVMDGYEMTRHIREREAKAGRAHTPIIAVTANAFEDEIRKCHECGMDDFISKPFEISDLAEKLEQFLSPREESASPDDARQKAEGRGSK